MSGAPERRIIIEVATPSVVKRLEDENAALRKDLNILSSQHQRLHETVYRLLEVVGELKRQKGKS